MGWKGESRRHSLARRGIKTAGIGCQPMETDGILNMSAYLKRMRDIFDIESSSMSYIGYIVKDKEELFGRVLEEAERDMEGIDDSELVRLEEYADKLYIEYVQRESKYAKVPYKSSGLRYEGYANKGDEIRAFDFVPYSSERVTYVQGIVLNDNATMPSQPDAKAYEISITRRVLNGEEIGFDKIGEIMYIPHETSGESNYDEMGINRISIIRRDD